VRHSRRATSASNARLFPLRHEERQRDNCEWPGGMGGSGQRTGDKGDTTVAHKAGAPSRLMKAASVLVTLVGVALGFVSPSDALD
jgi:hypothetical protein